jgi:dethiobiotin synthetase
LQLAARNCGNEFELDAICPVRFALPAAPAVAKGESAIDWSAIDAAFDRLRSLSDFVLIEGAGGSFAPIDDLFFSVDLANRYNAKTLLIVHDRLGMIHDLLTALEAVEKRLGVLPIWAVNTQNAAEFERISAPYLTQRFGGFYRLDNDFEIVADMLIK